MTLSRLAVQMFAVLAGIVAGLCALTVDAMAQPAQTIPNSAPSSSASGQGASDGAAPVPTSPSQAAALAPQAGSPLVPNMQVVGGHFPLPYAEHMRRLRLRTDRANAVLPLPDAARSQRPAPTVPSAAPQDASPTLQSGGTGPSAPSGPLKSVAAALGPAIPNDELSLSAANSPASIPTDLSVADNKSAKTETKIPCPTTYPNEIVELARALKNDPDLIYEYVYNNIQTLPQYGSLKGAEGALIDGKGTAFDQAELMVDLLTQASLTNTAISNPQLNFGPVWLTQAQLSNWLGTDAGAYSNVVALGDGGFPVVGITYTGPSSTLSLTQGSAATTIPTTYLGSSTTYNVVCAQVDWAWVTVQISGTTYTFDPAAKLSKQSPTDLASESSSCETTASQPAGLGYTWTSPSVNLATATGYTQSSFVGAPGGSGVESGATIGTQSFGGVTTDVSVSGINRSLVRSDLATYSESLVTYIRNHNPAASTADIIGGATINGVVVNTHQRWTSLPYACATSGCPTSSPVSCTGSWAPGEPCYNSTMPQAFRTTLQVIVCPSGTCSVETGGVNTTTFNSSDIYGHRLTVFFNGSRQALLSLDSVNELPSDTDTFSAGSAVYVQVYVTHPYGDPSYGSPPVCTTTNIVFDACGTLTLTEGNQYLIATGWGPVSRAMLEKHRKLLLENQQTYPSSPTVEPVLGESLATLGFTWLAELSQTMSTVDAVSGTKSDYLHAVGLVGMWTLPGGVSPYVDLPFNTFAVTQLVGRPGTTSGTSTPSESAAFFTIAGMSSILESGSLEQTQPGQTAVSTVKLLDNASAITGSGTITFDDINNGGTSASQSYWNSNQSTAISSDYGGSDYSRINDLVNTSNLRVIAAVQTPQSVGTGPWTGSGYFQISQAGNYIGAIITGGMSGGFGGNVEGPVAVNNDITLADQATGPSTILTIGGSDTGVAVGAAGNSAANNGQTNIDPVNMVAGDFENDHTDLAVGSAAAPYGLGFSRHYDSASRFAPSVMGAGWTHNWVYTATADSDGFEGFGADSPISGASAIAAILVLQDIYNTASSGTSTPSIDHLIIGVQVERWLMDQLTNNVVNVVQGPQVEQFVQLADGTYNAPLKSSAALTLSSGLYSYKTEGGTTLSFSSFGSSSPNPTYYATSIVYLSGPTITLSYNGSNQLTSVTNGMGRTLTLTYASGNVIGVTDGSRSISYTYDANNNLTAFTDPLSNQVTYTYDEPGRLTKIYYPSFPLNAFVSNTYDTMDRVSAQADPNGHVTNVYLAGYRTETDDPAGTADVLYFTPYGDTSLHIDGLGNQTTTTFDDIDRPLTVTAPEGNSVTYAYYAGTDPTQLQNVLSMTATPMPGSSLSDIVQSKTYDTNCHDQVKTATDGNGNVTTFTYNATTCTLSEVQQPTVGGSTPTTTYTYSGRGQVVTKTDPLGKVTTMTYDSGTEDLLTVVDDSSHLALEVQYGYDATGNATSVTDPNGNDTITSYDALRRKTEVTAPTSTSAQTKYSYSPDGLVIEVQAWDGRFWQATTTSYSYSGKKLTETDPSGHTSVLAYDILDRLASVTDPLNRVTAYGYDVLGRRTSISNAGIQATPLSVYTFTSNGKRATLTDANGNKTSFLYDGFDRLIETEYPSTTRGAGTSDSANYEAVLSYDANSNALEVRKRDGTDITLTYDPLNRPTEKAFAGGAGDVFYTYDVTGRLLSATYTSTTGPGVTYGFDTDGRLTSETTSTSSFSHILGFTLDANGNRTRVTWPDGFYATYAYDALNRMTSATDSSGNSLATYVYDPLSRRTSVSRGNGTSTTYGYDAASRLTNLAQSMPSATSYSVTYSLSYNNANQISGSAASNVTYDWQATADATASNTADGLNRDASIATVGTQPCGTSSGYDCNGNEANDGVHAYTYGHENRLTGVAISSTSTTATLTYDPTGRLNDYQATVGSTTTNTLFLYEGSRLVAEYNASSGALLRRYVHGPGTDEPIVWYEYTSGSQVLNWLHADAHGSVVAVSNGSGTVTQTSAYGPYGQQTAWSGSRFSYTGQIMLPELQLYFYKARVYNPSNGWFLQTDPVEDRGGADLYAYASEDPVNLGDPTGNSDAMQGTASGPVTSEDGTFQLVNNNPILARAQQLAAPWLTGFDPLDPNYHIYPVGPDVIGVLTPGSIPLSTMDTEIQNFAVPLQLNGSPNPGVYDVTPWSNPILNYHPADGIWINQTLPGHMFYNGEVVDVRFVVNNVVYLYTVGVGVGSNQLFNEFAGIFLFTAMHHDVKDAITEDQGIAEGLP